MLERRIIALVAALTLAAWSPAGAQKKGSEKPKRSYTVSEYTFGKFKQIHDLVGKERYGEALKLLGRLKNRRGLSDHELALVYQHYGYIESSQGQYKKALASFERCLAQDALPPAAQLNIRYNLGQLYLANEQPDQAVTTLKSWFAKAENPAPSAYYLLALAYVQQERMDLALRPALETVRRSTEPKEPWLQLLLSIYLHQQAYEKAAKLLEQLVSRFPKKTYWTQLAAVYAQQGREDRSLAVTQLADTQGFLDKDQELRNLARMYLYRQIPYQAARLLEKGLANKTIKADARAWQLLSDAWLNAREYQRALDPLARAAKLADDGGLYVRLAQVHMEQEKWTRASQALNQALRKGSLKDRGRAFLLLGICEYSSKRLDHAERAFKQAREYAKTRKSADRWLKHIERERAASRSSESDLATR